MITFYSIAALLSLLVLAWMVRPLLFPKLQTGVSSQRLNTDIYRDQLETLARDLAQGAISPADYEAACDELKLRLLDDTQELPAPRTPPASWWSARRTAVVLALLFLPSGFGLYAWLGTPLAIDPASAQKAEEDKILAMVDRLAAKLQANPDNVEGWAILARSYKVMGRLSEAEEAYKKTGALLETNPDIIADYADLLAMRANGQLVGEPLVLINKALALDPQHPMARMLSGVAAYQQGDYARAANDWEKLLPLMNPESPETAQLQNDIAQARAKAGLKPAARVANAESPVAAANNTTSPVAAVQDSAPQVVGNSQIIDMVDRLAARLKTNPGDLQGWAKLARSYKVLGRLSEAEEAYKKTGTLLQTNPDVITDFAELLALRAGNSLAGQPLVLINRALALAPRHPMALMLSGSAAMQRADYAAAVAAWEKLLPALPPDSMDAQQVRTHIAEARAKGGLVAPARP